MKNPFLIFMSVIAVVFAFVIISPLFHQEAPKNTIRILITQPMNAEHIRLRPLLEAKNYTYLSHGEDFDLISADPAKPKLQFQVVRDENTRALIFLKQEADVLYDSLSLSKTEWLKGQMGFDHVRIFTAPGEATSNLALNGANPVFQTTQIINAISAALPLKLWSETVFLNWVDFVRPQNSFLIPVHVSTPLRYLCTPSREGQQIAMLTREALEKIGITVDIHIYEPSLFYSLIRKREFDLFSARTLPGTKTILDLPNTLLIPLFRWKHGLILNSRVSAPLKIEASMDDSFRFLSSLQLPLNP